MSSFVLTKSTLIELIDIARTVSSAKNLQPLKYIAIADEPTKEKVYKPLVWAANLPNWTQKSNEKPSGYILVLDDTSIGGFSAVDSGIAMQTIMLGATAMGLDGCILASIDKKQYKKIFNLPDNLEPMFVIALGKSNETIKLVDIQDDDAAYRRDDQNNHIVPKRTLSEVVVL
jgi:nitroreductase